MHVYYAVKFAIDICFRSYFNVTLISILVFENTNINVFFFVLQMFYNCTCMEIAAPESAGSSGMMGRCQKDNGCPRMFLYFLVISVITSYTLSLGGIPGYILLLR